MSDENSQQMVFKKTWEEFRATQLLWWVNRTLHLFGWAIVVEVEADGKVTNAYPARTKFRGFDPTSEAEGFLGLSQYLEQSGHELLQEAESNPKDL